MFSYFMLKSIAKYGVLTKFENHVDFPHTFKSQDLLQVMWDPRLMKAQSVPFIIKAYCSQLDHRFT